jgi:hypothetical protein
MGHRTGCRTHGALRAVRKVEQDKHARLRRRRHQQGKGDGRDRQRRVGRGSAQPLHCEEPDEEGRLLRGDRLRPGGHANIDPTIAAVSTLAILLTAVLLGGRTSCGDAVHPTPDGPLWRQWVLAIRRRSDLHALRRHASLPASSPRSAFDGRSFRAPYHVGIECRRWRSRDQRW